MEKQEETLSILLRKQKQAVSQIKEFGKEVPEVKFIYRILLYYQIILYYIKIVIEQNVTQLSILWLQPML